LIFVSLASVHYVSFERDVSASDNKKYKTSITNQNAVCIWVRDFTTAIASVY